MASIRGFFDFSQTSCILQSLFWVFLLLATGQSLRRNLIFFSGSENTAESGLHNHEGKLDKWGAP